MFSDSRWHQPAGKRLPGKPFRDAGAAIWFLTALVTVILSSGLQVGRGRQVIVPIIQTALPESCTFWLQFGLDCPGCGLTRGFIHVAHGRFAQAYEVHALSLPLFAIVLLQLPLAMAHWAAIGGRWLRQFTRWNAFALIAMAVLMLGRWIYLLAQRFLLS